MLQSHPPFNAWACYKNQIDKGIRNLCRGSLVQRSFKESKYNGWRNDSVIRQLLAAVLGEERVKRLYTDALPMMSSIIATLEAEFLKEAMRIMSGSKFIADSVSDVQATLQFETQQARATAEALKL